MRKLAEGCSIELLVLDPYSPFVAQRGKEENRKYEDIPKCVTVSNEMHRIFIESIEEEDLRERISLDLYDAPPNLFMVITETTLLIGFYLREKKGQFFPQFELEIKPEGLSKPFIIHFESLLKEAQEKKALAVPV